MLFNVAKMSLWGYSLDMDKMLTAAQAAALLQVTRQTLRNWERSGSIEVVRIGGTVRYPLSTLTKETGQNEKPKE